jgi:hypothetical protein
MGGDGDAHAVQRRVPGNGVDVHQPSADAGRR